MAVEGEAVVVDLAVEVDRQLRDAGNGLADIDQRRRAVLGDDPAGHSEVAVEPAVQQHSSVHLDPEQAPIGHALVGVRVDAQTRRVGVRPDDAGRVRAPVGKAPGDEGRAAPGEPGIGQGDPRLGFVELAEPGRPQQIGGCLGRMPRRWRGIEVVEQLLHAPIQSSRE